MDGDARIFSTVPWLLEDECGWFMNEIVSAFLTSLGDEKNYMHTECKVMHSRLCPLSHGTPQKRGDTHMVWDN